MTKTIILSDLVITNLEINYIEQYVKATYKMVDANGESWISGTAYFWVTLPEIPREIDFQLPTGYIPTLVQLQTDADTALTAKFLV